MLREASIVVPDRDNAGRDLSTLKDSIAAGMVAAFGGATMIPATGLWADHGKLFREPVTQIVAAANDNPTSEATLRDIASRVLVEGDQLAAYVRFPSGAVEIIERRSANEQAA